MMNDKNRKLTETEIEKVVGGQNAADGMDLLNNVHMEGTVRYYNNGVDTHDELSDVSIAISEAVDAAKKMLAQSSQ